MKVPKLKLKMWQEIIYFLFVGIIPAVLAAIPVFYAAGEGEKLFKISFASVGAVLLVVIVIRKFVLRNYIKKLQQRCVMLEHDYETGNGNPSQIATQWGKFNSIIFGYSALTTLLSLALMYIFVTALSEGLLQFRFWLVCILLSVLIGLLWKMLLFIRRVLNEK